MEGRIHSASDGLQNYAEKSNRTTRQGKEITVEDLLKCVGSKFCGRMYYRLIAGARGKGYINNRKALELLESMNEEKLLMTHKKGQEIFNKINSNIALNTSINPTYKNKKQDKLLKKIDRLCRLITQTDTYKNAEASEKTIIYLAQLIANNNEEVTIEDKSKLNESLEAYPQISSEALANRNFTINEIKNLFEHDEIDHENIINALNSDQIRSLLEDTDFVTNHLNTVPLILDKAAKREDFSDIIQTMIIALPPKVSVDIAKTLISTEIEKTKYQENLNRAETPASIFMNEFQQFMLKDVKENFLPSFIDYIKPPLVPKDKEVNKPQEWDKKIEKDVIKRAQGALDLIKEMIAEEGVIPEDLKEVYQHLYNETEYKFHGEGCPQVLSMFFLRFLIPALITPQEFDIPSRYDDERQQNQAILLTKPLQNIANGTLPGVKQKNYSFFDEFVEDEIPYNKVGLLRYLLK